MVARAILFACENRRREIVVGGGGYAISLFGRLFPRLTDLAMEATGFSAQTTDRAPRPERADSLHRTKKGGTERSLTSPVAPVRKTSLLLEAQMHPVATTAALAGLGAVLGGTAALDHALSATDWLALVSGMAFAGNNLLARATPRVPMASKTVAVFLGGTLTAALMLGLGAPVPVWGELSAGTLLGVLAYGFIWLGLAMVTWQYGVTHLETGRAAVILITELVVAVSSSVLMGEEQLLPRMVLGALLIGAAALLEATDNPEPVEAGKRIATDTP